MSVSVKMETRSLSEYAREPADTVRLAYKGPEKACPRLILPDSLTLSKLGECQQVILYLGKPQGSP